MLALNISNCPNENVLAWSYQQNVTSMLCVDKNTKLVSSLKQTFFSSPLVAGKNKLECFSLTSFAQPPDPLFKGTTLPAK
jgi:hypothetical protein